MVLVPYKSGHSTIIEWF